MVHFFSSVMFVLIFLVIVGLFSSPLSFPYLIRESEGDIRAKPEYDREEFEDDRRKNNTVIVGLDPAIKERDVRLKAEHDVEKRLNMTKKKSPATAGLFVYFSLLRSSPLAT